MWFAGARRDSQLVRSVLDLKEGFFLDVDVVNRAYQMYRLSMPIWSFYDKTYIVIPTCTSDISRPSSPLSPAIAVDLRIEVQV